MKLFALTLTSAWLLSATAMAAVQSPAVSGGVGESSQNAIQQVQQNYNLKLVFTGEGGMYLSDVAVTILDRNGDPVVSQVTDGPLLLVDLDPGRYTIESQAESFTRTQQVTVNNSLKTYHVRFPVKDNIQVSQDKALTY